MLRIAQSETRGVRRIAPHLVAPPQVEDTELQREAPREPLSELGRASPPEAKPREADAPIFRPVATAAGRLEGEGMVIAIAGIEIVEPEQTCRRGDGTSWPCGTVARTAFRSFLRARAVACDLPQGAVPRRLSATCTVGGVDVGAWLVSNGWAKVAIDGPYAENQRAAIDQGRGIFGPGPQALPQDDFGGSAPPAAGIPLGSTEPPTAPGSVLPREGAGLY